MQVLGEIRFSEIRGLYRFSCDQLFSRSNDSDGTGNEGAAAQQSSDARFEPRYIEQRMVGEHAHERRTTYE